MLQEIFIAAAAGGNPSNALSQMGFEHLIHEMTTKPGDFAVSWVVLLTLIAMSAMSWYWTVINIFRTTRLKSALLDIQNGRGEDRHGWIQRVF